MKKIILIALIAMGFSAATQAQTKQLRQLNILWQTKSCAWQKPAIQNNPASKLVTEVPGQSKTYQWDHTDWLFQYESEFSYTPSGKIASELRSDTVTQITERTKYTYNGNDMIIEILTEFYDQNSGNWNPIIREVYDYDAQGARTLSVTQFWENGNGWVNIYGSSWDISWDAMTMTQTVIENSWNGSAFSPVYKSIQVILGNGKITEETNFGYDQITGWEATDRYEYLYDALYIDTAVVVSTWDGSDWVLYMKAADFAWFNVQEQLLDSNKVYLWSGSEWVLSYRESYIHGINGSMNYLLQAYNGPDLTDDSRNTIQYDNHANLVHAKFEMWTGTEWFITYESVHDYTYDIRGNAEQVISKETDFFSGGLEYTQKITYSHYSVVTGVGKTNKTSTLIYPNPTQDAVTIRLGDNQVSTINLKDLQGRTIQTAQTSASEYKMDLNHVEAGVYLIEIRSDKNSSVTKIIKN